MADAADAVESTPENGWSVAQESEEPTDNGACHDDALDRQASTASNTARSRGSKVSNLRAAFEQSAGANGTAAHALALAAGDGKRNITPKGRTASLDAELARLRDVAGKEREMRDALARERELREAGERQVRAMDAEMETLRDQLKRRDEILQGGGGERQELVRGRDHALAELRAAKGEAAAHAAESSSLLKQLADLKRSIATNTRLESHEMTDNAFCDELSTLAYQIQGWVVQHFRRTKLDATAGELCARIAGMEDGRYVDLLTPLYERWTCSAKLDFFRATVMSLMMPIFTDPFLFGLPTDPTWAQALRLASEELPGVLGQPAYNRWRANTLDLVRQCEAMAPFVDLKSSETTATICDVLSGMCEIEESETRAAALNTIVKRAIALAHTLRVQRARYQMQLPRPSSTFETATMEDISDENDGADGREIRCAIFPAVIKIRDGNNVDLVFKAKVLVDPPSESSD